jgi:hypothetical protein
MAWAVVLAYLHVRETRRHYLRACAGLVRRRHVGGYEVGFFLRLVQLV